MKNSTFKDKCNDILKNNRPSDELREVERVDGADIKVQLFLDILDAVKVLPSANNQSIIDSVISSDEDLKNVIGAYEFIERNIESFKQSCNHLSQAYRIVRNPLKALSRNKLRDKMKDGFVDKIPDHARPYLVGLGKTLNSIADSMVEKDFNKVKDGIEIYVADICTCLSVVSSYDRSTRDRLRKSEYAHASDNNDLRESDNWN